MKNRLVAIVVAISALSYFAAFGYFITHPIKSPLENKPGESLIESSIRINRERDEIWQKEPNKSRRDIDSKFKKEGIDSWCSNYESVENCLSFLSRVKSNPELMKSLQKASKRVNIIFLANFFGSDSEGVWINIHASPEEIIRRL